jgi:hypothetical protein
MSSLPHLEMESRGQDRRKHQKTRLSRAITAVLRYDVPDWLDLPSLQTMVRRRFHLNADFGDLFIAILADPVRFELVKWECGWWCRATYRH